MHIWRILLTICFWVLDYLEQNIIGMHLCLSCIAIIFCASLNLVQLLSIEIIAFSPSQLLEWLMLVLISWFTSDHIKNSNWPTFIWTKHKTSVNCSSWVLSLWVGRCGASLGAFLRCSFPSYLSEGLLEKHMHIFIMCSVNNLLHVNSIHILVLNLRNTASVL